SRSRRSGPRRVARPCRRTGSGDHRIQRLPRHEQDGVVGPADDRPRVAGADRAARPPQPCRRGERLNQRPGRYRGMGTVGGMARRAQGELDLGGLPRPLVRVTPAKLSTWIGCPRRYRMAYLDRPAPARGGAWAHNTLGAVVHTALRALFDLAPDRRRPHAAAGRVDRIDERDGELVVVDYKTGRQALTVDDARGSQALALYAFAARRTLRRECRRVELHHLPTGTVAGWEHTDQSLTRHLQRAEEAAEEIALATDTLETG